MKLILTLNNVSEEIKKIAIPTISIITALRNAIDTDSDMLENPPVFENNKTIIEMYWAEEVSEEQENNFKNRTINALKYIFSQAEIEGYNIEWE